MITEYANGKELLYKNKALLDTNPYQSVFFYWDAPLLSAPDKTQYALKCESDGKSLLALKVEPYALLLLGDPACCGELLRYLTGGGYRFGNYLCGCDVGETLTEILASEYGKKYREALAMEFMEARATDAPLSPDVLAAEEADADELTECAGRFIADCGLTDTADRDRIAREAGQYRVLRRDGRIVSMAKYNDASENERKISFVYTRDEYRGRGYARAVVGSLTREILDSGRIATLNVDRHNPVTNHLYRALGFRPLFAQGEYRPEDPESAE